MSDKHSESERFDETNPLPHEIKRLFENRLDQKVDAQTEMVEVLGATVRYRIRKQTESWGLSGNIFVLPKESANGRNGC